MDRHFILTMGRSGSNSLRDMLNQSPELFNFGELLGEWNTIRKLQIRLPFTPKTHEGLLDMALGNASFWRGNIILQGLRQRLRGEAACAKSLRRVRSFGVKEFSLNLQRYGLGHYLDRHPDIKVVGLQRLGIVDRMLSNEMLRATRVVAVRTGIDTGTRRLTLDADRIIEKLSVIERENAELDAMLRRLPPERVRVCSYEELFSDEQRRSEIMSELFDFLGVERVATETRMRKIIHAPIHEVVENYEECLRATRGTHYEALLRAAAEQ